MGHSISNGRPEDKELTRRVEILKKQFADKNKQAEAERGTAQAASSSR
jgi:hypothetical protein